MLLCGRMNVQLKPLEDKKSAIFQSTLELIKEHGFHGTPMSQIAQAAGVATGTIYHYFASKDELIIELFKYSKQQAHQAIFEEDDPTSPYRERLGMIWIRLFKHYIRHPEVLSFFNQFYSSPFVKATFTHETLCFQDEISLFLQQGINEGHIKALDINILSAAFIGTVGAAAKRHNNGRFTFQEKDLIDMSTILWDGIKL